MRMEIKKSVEDCNNGSPLADSDRLQICNVEGCNNAMLDWWLFVVCLLGVIGWAVLIFDKLVR